MAIDKADPRVAEQAPPTVGAVERRGIEYIPLAHRWGKPSGLFWMWAGATWNVEFVVYGTLGIVVFGLSFFQALAMIVVGNLFWVLCGLASLQGPRTGTTTFASNRAAFGPNGNRVPAIFNWVTQVGFEIEGIALVVLAAITLTTKAGGTADTALKIVFIIIAVLLQAALPMLGHAAVLRVLRWLTFPFVVLFVLMAILTTSKVDLHVHTTGGWGDMVIFLALVISAGGLGFSENGNDYSRYLQPDSPAGRITAAVAFGGAIPAILLQTLGAAVATGVPGASSMTGLATAFPGWFVWPYLVFAIAQILAINSIDLYSSGVTLQSVVPKLKRVQCVAIDTVICGFLAAYTVFSSKFTSLLADFLLFIIVWLAPWCAIYLVDSWLRRNRYDNPALLNERSGIYYRNGGFHWPAIIALAAGMVASALWLNAYSPYVGPLASRIGGSSGSDFSVFMGLIVGGLVYWLLARHSVSEETAQLPAADVPASPI